MQLKNKVVIITGGATSIEKGLSKGILEKGAKVCFCDCNKQEGFDSLKELQTQHGEENVMFIECDVTNHDSLNGVFQKTKEKFGCIDVLINNAGIIYERPDWRRCISVNLIGTIDGSKLADLYMSLQNGGRGGVVLNMSSICGLVPHVRVPVYCASKFGIVGATRSLALRAQDRLTGLRFVCLCPDRTDAGQGIRANTVGGLEQMGFEDTNPLICDPSDILSLETVVNAAIGLIETDDNNGGVMLLTPKQGCEYVHGEPGSKN